MRHLTHADYIRMPWANGRGTTTEMLRLEVGAALLLRLSVATVSENGPFSIFPGVERSLTVISGPGFQLTGPGISLDCKPLVPVSFPGDVAVNTVGTGGHVSQDFNVISASYLPRPEVTVLQQATTIQARGDRLCLFALGQISVNGRAVQPHDLIVWEDDLVLGDNGAAIVVRTAI